MKVAVAHSDSIKPEKAVVELVQTCQKDIEIDKFKYQAALFFSNYGLNRQHDKMLSLIKDNFPKINLIGCSSYAEICSSSKNGYCKSSNVLILIGSDTIRLHTGIITNLNKDMEKDAIIRLIHEALPQNNLKDPSLAFIFPEYQNINGKILVEAFSEALGDDTAIFGGVAADNDFSLKHTKQFFNSMVYEHSVPFLIFDGTMHHDYALSEHQGWEDCGQYQPIETKDHAVLKIGPDSAIDYLKQYLTPILPGPFLPVVGATLSVKPKKGEPYIEDIHIAGEEDKHFDTKHTLPKSAKVKIMLPSINKMIEDIEEQLSFALERYGAAGNDLKLVCLFSCSARAQAFGCQRETQKIVEYETVLKTLKKFYQEKEINRELPKIAGFYAHGEIVSKEEGYHNASLVMVLLGENSFRPNYEILALNFKDKLIAAEEKLSQSEQKRQQLESELAKLKEAKNYQEPENMVKRATSARLLAFATLIKILKAVNERKVNVSTCFKNTGEEVNISQLTAVILNKFHEYTNKPFPVKSEDTLRKFLTEAIRKLKDC